MIPRFYKLVNEWGAKRLSKKSMWDREMRKWWNQVDVWIQQNAKNRPTKGRCHSKVQFRSLKSKPANVNIIAAAVANTPRPHIQRTERSSTWPEDSHSQRGSSPSWSPKHARAKRGRETNEDLLNTQLAVRDRAPQIIPSIRVPHFKSPVPVLNQMLVVNILRSEKLDPATAESCSGIQNVLRHLAKTLLTCFTTSVIQKWDGLDKRLHRASRRSAGTYIKRWFCENRPSKYQIKLDPLFWYCEWVYWSSLFHRILKLRRPFKLRYSTAERAPCLRFDKKDLQVLFPNQHVLKTIGEHLGIAPTSLIYTKQGQVRVLIKRSKRKNQRRRTGLELLKKHKSKILRVLEKYRHKKAKHFTCDISSKLNVLCLDPGQKNLFEGVVLKINAGRAIIEPVKVTNGLWRLLSGTSDFVHSWNQALEKPGVVALPVALRQRKLHRYYLRKKKSRDRALDTVLYRQLKCNPKTPICVLVGNWTPSAMTIAGNPSSEISAILKRTSPHADVVLVNEHNTSKLCSCGHSEPLKSICKWAIPKWFLKQSGLLRFRRWRKNRRKRNRSINIEIPAQLRELSLKELVQKATEHVPWSQKRAAVSLLFQKITEIFKRPGQFSSWTPVKEPKDCGLKISKCLSRDVKWCGAEKRLVSRDYDAAISIGVKALKNI
ncbi:MAG: hypothetical protein D6732_08915 [Methanobacteriota archaeon]|nr:MAG: hypothetical protein D6732_08915 [Euryarchaeota archaeon]